jgi:hypothetical protein
MLGKYTKSYDEFTKKEALDGLLFCILKNICYIGPRQTSNIGI